MLHCAAGRCTCCARLLRVRTLMRRVRAILALVLLPTDAYAHAGAHGPHDLLQSWTFDAAILSILAFSAAAYCVGWRTPGRRRGRLRAAHRARAAWFAVGMLALVVALVSPVDALGELLFAGHMVQHLILTMVAAPVLVMSDAGIVIVRALPHRARRVAGRVFRIGAVRGTWGVLTHPVVAWALHAAALVLWHVPAAYERAILDERVHALEHWSFLVTALLFWWPVLAPRARQRIAFGSAAVYLFAAATASGILGAMIALSGAAWYTVHAHGVRP